MNTIYGNKVIGNNNTISINGQNCLEGENKKVDVKKTTNANNISRITVNCDLADVQINAVDTNNITTHFFGQVTTDGSIHFDVSVIGNEVKIVETITGSYVTSDLLFLHIDIPSRMLDSIVTLIE